MSELRVVDAVEEQSRPASRAEALLRAGVPLSLLLDLAGSDPHSTELYALERAS